MNPVFLEIGPLTIHWYGVFMALAFTAGLINWIVLGRRRGFDVPFCSDLLFWVMVAGVIGARLNYVLADVAFFMEHPEQIVRIHEGGLIFYGGFIGSAIAVYILARHRSIPLLSLTDFIGTSLPLSHALGRIGCFMNGCCFGKPTESALSCTFPHSSLPWWQQHYVDKLIKDTAPESLPVHPVQLYETGANLLIYVVLVILFLRVKRTGVVTGVYFILYPLARLLLENLRGTERLMLGPISMAQALSIALMAIGTVLLTVSLLRSPAAEEAPAISEEDTDGSA